jgi:TonB family protein
MSNPAVSNGPAQPAPAEARPETHDVLPTLFGEGYGTYAVRPANFAASVVLHSLAVAFILVSAHFAIKHSSEIKQQVTLLATEISPYILPASKSAAGGGGGGGDRDKFQAPKGKLPKASMEQFTPPMRVLRAEKPRLEAEPSVVLVQPVPVATNIPYFGDPKSTVLGPDSNGTGSGGGIGSGSGGGVGSGHGPGVGPGYGGGIGGGVFRVGGGVSPPKQIYSPEPEYSEEARKAKYQGVVVLWIVVGPDGRTHDVKVQRSLGLGLDEKAIEAVRQWRFEPARKDGQPVAVQVAVEVNFRLY